MGCGWFWAWAVVGLTAALAALSSLGVFLLVPVVVVAAYMARRPAMRHSAFGLLTGAGASLLFVAWLNRSGPGTTCWQHTMASGCEQHLNPLPWLLAGLALFASGIVAHARRGSFRAGELD